MPQLLLDTLDDEFRNQLRFYPIIKVSHVNDRGLIAFLVPSILATIVVICNYFLMYSGALFPFWLHVAGVDDTI